MHPQRGVRESRGGAAHTFQRRRRLGREGEDLTELLCAAVSLVCDVSLSRSLCVQKKLLLSLIRRRRSSHSVLQLSSYADFKQDMLDFIERLYRVPEPFLLQVRLTRPARLRCSCLSSSVCVCAQMLKRSGHPGVRAEPVTSSSQDRQKTSTAAEDHG